MRRGRLDRAQINEKIFAVANFFSLIVPFFFVVVGVGRLLDGVRFVRNRLSRTGPADTEGP
jgi:hypothetical protein